MARQGVRSRPQRRERIRLWWITGSGAAKFSSLYRRGDSAAPQAFADPLASRQEVRSASAGNAGRTPPRSTNSGCALAGAEAGREFFELPRVAGMRRVEMLALRNEPDAVVPLDAAFPQDSLERLP